VKTSKTSLAWATWGAVLSLAGAACVACGALAAGWLLIGLGCFSASMAQVC
jgi:hypothetical protein